MNRSRLLVLVCLATTFLLIGLVVFRAKTNKPPNPSSPTQDQIVRAEDIASKLARIKTAIVSKQQFDEKVQSRVEALGGDLADKERASLIDCMQKFYACYSSGDFDLFCQFRLIAPFTVGEGVSTYARNDAAKNGIRIGSDREALLHAWNALNGTNRIGEVDIESIVISLHETKDSGYNLRKPTIVSFPDLGASCWEGGVIYSPSPEELLKEQGRVRFFQLQMFVRFHPLIDGPATPLVLIGYWDQRRSAWLPYALCTQLQVGSYETLF